MYIFFFFFNMISIDNLPSNLNLENTLQILKNNSDTCLTKLGSYNGNYKYTLSIEDEHSLGMNFSGYISNQKGHFSYSYTDHNIFHGNTFLTVIYEENTLNSVVVAKSNSFDGNNYFLRNGKKGWQIAYSFGESDYIIQVLQKRALMHKDDNIKPLTAKNLVQSCSTILQQMYALSTLSFLDNNE